MVSKTKIMDFKPEISCVSPNEMDEAKYKMVSIRFDCHVKMFDCGQRETQAAKPLPPQWFKSELKLTLESIADADPCVLGMRIKEVYLKLKNHIEQYENF